MTASLKIELGDRANSVKPGAPVQGTVIVDVETQTECQALRCRRFFTTQGYGNVERQAPADIATLFSGTWEAGTYRYDFSFEAPAGPPFSYVGENLTLAWMMEAEVQGSDVELVARAEFLLVNPVRTLSAPDQIKVDPHQNPMAAMTTVFLLILSVVSFVTGSFLLLVVIFPFFLVLLFQLYKIGKRGLAERQLGKVEIEIKPEVRAERAADPPEFRFEINMRPKLGTSIRTVTAKLRGWEKCMHGTSGQGSSSSWKTHRVHVADLELARDVKIAVDRRPFSLRGEFVLPADAARSFAGRDNMIEWFVEFQVDVDRSADFVQRFPITVL